MQAFEHIIISHPRQPRSLLNDQLVELARAALKVNGMHQRRGVADGGAKRREALAVRPRVGPRTVNGACCPSQLCHHRRRAGHSESPRIRAELERTLAQGVGIRSERPTCRAHDRPPPRCALIGRGQQDAQGQGRRGGSAANALRQCATSVGTDGTDGAWRRQGWRGQGRQQWRRLQRRRHPSTIAAAGHELSPARGSSPCAGDRRH